MRLIKKNSELKTDLELVLEYKESFNNEIIGELYKRYHHIVFGVALKYLKNTENAQDAQLDVFNNLFEHLIKYKIDDFKSWLLTVTRNHCLRILKENTKFTPLDTLQNGFLSVDFMETEHEIDLHITKEKQLKELEHALKELKPAQQICVTLFYINDKSYQEISDATGFNVKKVKSYIQNGKRNLQLLMEKK
jgi:RNA polymerase sigma-70 factor (ECF subfamily)